MGSVLQTGERCLSFSTVALHEGTNYDKPAAGVVEDWLRDSLDTLTKVEVRNHQ